MTSFQIGCMFRSPKVLSNLLGSEHDSDHKINMSNIEATSGRNVIWKYVVRIHFGFSTGALWKYLEKNRESWISQGW